MVRTECHDTDLGKIPPDGSGRDAIQPNSTDRAGALAKSWCRGRGETPNTFGEGMMTGPKLVAGAERQPQILAKGAG